MQVMTQEKRNSSQNDPTGVLDTIEQLVSTLSVEDAWAIHKSAMSRYGFDKLLYGFTRFNTRNSYGDRNDLLLLSSMPDGYMDRFIDDDLYRTAPMTRWARDNVGAMSWGWLAQNLGELSAEERQVVEFNKSYGLTAGYTIAFQDALTRHKGAIALVAKAGVSQFDADRVWAEKGREINVLNQIAHLKFTALPLPKARSKLSGRQREVLEWVGDGKTMQDIATILGLTQATVEKHLKNARDSLSVETTAQAVRKASVQNQIFVLEH